MSALNLYNKVLVINIQNLNQRRKGMERDYLLDILKGCFDSQRINQYELKLKEAANHPNFLNTLLTFIPGQEHNMLMMILSTLKNFLQAKYDQESGESPLSEGQRRLIKQNILNLFYQLYQNQNAVLIYHEICKIIIKNQYPWEGIDEALKKDLQQRALAAVHFSNEIAAHYEYQIPKKQLLYEFVSCYFPKFQVIVQGILGNYNYQSSKLLEEILKTFYSCFHIEIPPYLKDFERIDKWLIYLKTIIAAPLQINTNNIILATKILQKFLKLYTSVDQNGQGFKVFSLQFIDKYSVQLYELCLAHIEISNQQASGVILKCISNVCQNQNLRKLITQEHCKGIIYTSVLPRLQRTNQDTKCFYEDGLQYINRAQDLSFRPFRSNAYDLLEIMMKHLIYNGKAQIIRFIEYSTSVLQNLSSRDEEKQVILQVIVRLHHLILSNKYLKKQLQPLIQQLLLPLLCQNKPILISQTLQLLQIFVPHTACSLVSMKKIMELVYGFMLSNNLVVQFHAALCFTSLLTHQQAKQQSKPHFEKILQIYIKMLDIIDHEKLLLSLEKIVKNFQSQIIPVAVDLVNHLMNMFYTYSKRRNDNGEQGQQDDNNNSATAALNNIEQIVSANLTNEQYWIICPSILEIFKNLFVYYGAYLVQGLNLMSSFVFHSPSLTDYQFPYVLCRKLLQGNNQILNCCNFNQQLLEMIAQTERTDLEYCEDIIAILKNLIQKMPLDILFKYPLPKNPQLLLCIIQNKKIPHDSLNNLDISEVTQSLDWVDILESYTAQVYGIGSVSNPQNLKIITGLSLFPWLKNTFGPVIIKKILFIISNNQEQLEEQNTLQLMERYAREQDEEEQEYHESSGINYSYKYKSPYDSSKDKDLMMCRLKNLTNEQAALIMNSLSNHQKSKLEALFV